MIDVNEVLRRAFEAGRMPPKLEEINFRPGYAFHPHFHDPKAIDLRRRPDGVWEMPE